MAFISNTTPTPNWLYNGEMKKMTGTELKVVLLVTRKTLGWFDPMTSKRKTQDYISQSQFMEFTGQSHTAIAKAIQTSVKIGWIIARDRNGNLCDTSEKRRRRKVWYQLGNMFTNKISKQQSGLDENLSNKTTKSKQLLDTHLSNKTTKSKQLLDTHLSNKVDNTKETLTKETIQKETHLANSTEFAGNNINSLIEKFKPINPTYEKLFKNTTQRKALENLVKKFTYEKVAGMIDALPEIVCQKYAPSISTPIQLENKLGQLLIFVKSNNSNNVIKL